MRSPNVLKGYIINVYYELVNFLHMSDLFYDVNVKLILKNRICAFPLLKEEK